MFLIFWFLKRFEKIFFYILYLATISLFITIQTKRPRVDWTDQILGNGGKKHGRGSEHLFEKIVGFVKKTLFFVRLKFLETICIKKIRLTKFYSNRTQRRVGFRTSIRKTKIVYVRKSFCVTYNSIRFESLQFLKKSAMNIFRSIKLFNRTFLTKSPPH